MPSVRKLMCDNYAKNAIFSTVKMCGIELTHEIPKKIKWKTIKINESDRARGFWTDQSAHPQRLQP